MLKTILSLEGTQELTKNEQKEINGGSVPPDGYCPIGMCQYVENGPCKRESDRCI